jgi:hypothetical protein
VSPAGVKKKKLIIVQSDVVTLWTLLNEGLTCGVTVLFDCQ